MHDRTWHAMMLAKLNAAAAAVLLSTAKAQTTLAPCDSQAVAALPVIERPARVDTNNTLVILLTGDGGWAHADEGVAAGLLARGAAVIGLNMRSYLSDRRTPEVAARDVGCVAREYLTRWRRERLMLLGYSRGADIAPFVASRLPTDLRDKLNLVALVSPSTHASFQFHWIDLIRDIKRADDLPFAPELERLRGLQVLCIYGLDDASSGCRDADSTIVARYARTGGHRIAGGFDVMADVLGRGLYPPPSPEP